MLTLFSLPYPLRFVVDISVPEEPDNFALVFLLCRLLVPVDLHILAASVAVTDVVQVRLLVPLVLVCPGLVDGVTLGGVEVVVITVPAGREVLWRGT